MTLRLEIPTLEAERPRLHAPRMEDFPAFGSCFRTHRSRRNGGPDADAMWRFRLFGHLFGQWVLRGYGEFVSADKASDRGIGAAGIWHPRHWPEPEIGWTLWNAADEGKGLAHKAARAALAFAFGRVGLQTCASYVDPENARSVAPAERSSARRDAKAARPDLEDLVLRHAPGEVA